MLEHVDNPETACRELMRIGKRGCIDTPTRAKDLFFATAKISHHKWAVSQENGVLVFTDYTPSDLEGLGTNLLLEMNCAPRNKREKALAALEYVKPDQLIPCLHGRAASNFVFARYRTPQRARGEGELKNVRSLLAGGFLLLWVWG